MISFHALPLNTAARSETFAYWRGGFSLDELDKIVALGEAAGLRGAQVGQGSGDTNLRVRRGTVGWVESDEASNWLYSKLVTIISELNRDFFGFDLWGVVGGLQYTVYDATAGQPEYYDWHVDMLGKSNMQRKLSFVLQLTDPMEYEGGELKLRGMGNFVVPKEQGLAVAFPSYVLHQVTPVTEGIRRSLVAWVSGPDFR